VPVDTLFIMHGTIEVIVAWVLGTILYAGIPLLMVRGWIWWFRAQERPVGISWLTVVGVGLATVSAVLAAYALFHAHFIRAFDYYDPLLMKFYGWGMLLALGGLICSLTGSFRKTVIRWPALVSSFGMLALWFISAMGE